MKKGPGDSKRRSDDLWEREGVGRVSIEIKWGSLHLAPWVTVARGGEKFRSKCEGGNWGGDGPCWLD